MTTRTRTTGGLPLFCWPFRWAHASTWGIQASADCTSCRGAPPPALSEGRPHSVHCELTLLRVPDA